MQSCGQGERGTSTGNAFISLLSISKALENKTGWTMFFTESAAMSLQS